MPSDDVSRETPPAPASARGVFPVGRLPLVERYAELLATAGVERGLIGPREAPRLWERHLLNCALLSEWLPRDVTVCDLGSGAGLPGLVVALARPDLSVTLVEPLLRRTTFLDEVVEELALGNVDVIRGRAEELHGSRRFDVVTSRAVAPLTRLLRWSMPLVQPEGAMVAMKGSSLHDEIREAAQVLTELGCAEPEVRELGVDSGVSTTLAVRVSWADPGGIRWPPASAPARTARRATARKHHTRTKSKRRQGS